MTEPLTHNDGTTDLQVKNTAAMSCPKMDSFFVCLFVVVAVVVKSVACLLTAARRDGNFHGSGMSHATTASQKPSFGTLWKVGDAMIGRGNAGWTKSKGRHPCPRQNC